MKIAFFGSHHAFNYRHIGGTDSLVRRLSTELVRQRHARVDLVLYGLRRTAEEMHLPGLKSRYYRTFEESLEALKEGYDHVVTIYLLPKDRLAFAGFRGKHRHDMRFHMVYQVWPDSIVKRWLMFSDALLVRFNGRVFGVSPRLVERARRWDSKAALLWPPVPSDYFTALSAKKIEAKCIRVTFMGRVDPGKGVLEAIDLFHSLSERPDVELAFYGMHWRHDPEAVSLHERLLAQERFLYVHTDFHCHSPSVDEMVRTALRDTDIFVQPYRRLSSTIDTPMLLLEAMASLAAVITKPLGDIPHIYGQSPCLIHGLDGDKRAVELVFSARDWLNQERERIDQRNKTLRFDVESVARTFSSAVGIN